MGQMVVVTLREGIEMFLIVAIAAAYLRKTATNATAAPASGSKRDATGIQALP